MLILLIGIDSFGQGKPLNPSRDTGLKSEVKLIRADSLVGINNELTIICFYGNVIFKHRGATLYCNTAIQNSTSNLIEAYGKVKINQGDTLTITGDTLYYDGNTRFARVLGRRVVLTDDEVTVTSRRMNYNLNASEAFYNSRGTIRQDSSILKSDQGTYNTQTKLFHYEGNVTINNPKYDLKTEKLDYDSNTKIATFLTETEIVSKDGTVNASSGTYNLETEQTNFQGRSTLVNDDYTLVADTLLFNRGTDSGLAIGRAEFTSKKDNLSINGDRIVRDGAIGLTQVTGNSILKNFEKSDTLYMAADTMYAYEYLDSELPVDTFKTDSVKSQKRLKLLIADGNVKLFRTDFQSLTDSLRYDMKDSTITFFQKPILWSNENQLLADTIVAYLRNDKIKNLYLKSSSFVISKDTAQNFNQIKGRQIQALFDDSTAIEKVYVDGNGESIYFAVDEKNKLIGLNRVICSKMSLSFNQTKVQKIVFMGSPESKLIPPGEIGGNDVKLSNFAWRISEKPSKESIVGSNIVKSDVKEPEIPVEEPTVE
jgi:lipopolysaccharide assembly outer membrane protein LptD (OstA)